MRLTRPAAAGICLIWMAACSVGGSGPGRPSIDIGVDLPLSGPEARAATPVLNGIRFFYRRHPTVDGFDVVLKVMDDAHGGLADPQAGLADIQRFIADPNLLAVIGPFDASVARKEIPAANQAGLAMISPAISTPCLTKDLYLPAALNPSRIAFTCSDAGVPSARELRPSHTNNFFRLTTTDDLQGPAAADFASKTLHLLRVAVVSDREAYGEALAAGFSSRFQKDGGSVEGRLDLDAEASADATSFLQQMKAAGAQAIYYGGVTSGKGCSVRSRMKGIFDAGEATPFLGGDGIAEDPACIGDAGANSAGIYATVPAADAGSSPTATPVISAFKAAYPGGGDYGPYTVLAYDAAAVLDAALDRAFKNASGAVPPRGNVISQLSATTAFSGATGSIGFDVAGDTTNRQLAVLEATSGDPKAAWKFAGAIDYSKTLPY